MHTLAHPRAWPALLALAAGCGDKDPGSTDGDSDAPSGFETDDDGDGLSEADGDCDDANAEVHPGAEEVCDGIDNDCSGAVDDDATDATIWYPDADADGYGAEAYAVTACEAPEGHSDVAGDCHDLDAGWYPGAPEDDCSSLNDYNCDGSVGETDADGDGFAACNDCDDADAAVHPDADEVCDGVDNDCSGAADDDATDADTWYADTDGDGHGDPATGVVTCEAPAGSVEDATDCDDGSADVFPGATELCNEVDDDCDNEVDEDDAEDAATWFADQDGDGAGDPGDTRTQCEQPTGYITDATDCDDADASSRPGLPEVCDGLDNDCDGTADNDDAVDAATWYLDDDGDTFGDATTSRTACSQPTDHVADATDCDDDAAAVYPGATETCNETDDDCDGHVDEEASDAGTWYADTDGDGHGGDLSVTDCDQPSGYTADDGDCDDTDATAYPGAVELCDGIANDCDTATSWVSTDEDGTVSMLDTAGAWTDLSTTWAAGSAASATAISLTDAGSLWVCDGTYHVNLDITADVDITGLHGADTTVLDGAESGAVTTVTGVAVTFDGITLSGGSATNGGGIDATGGADVSLFDVDIRDNVASERGGGIHLEGSGLTALDIRLEDNLAGVHGGGVCLRSSSTATLDGGGILDNATDANPSYGGGVSVTHSSLTATDMVWSGNSAYWGGAYFGGTASVLVLDGLAVTGNTADVGGGLGTSGGSIDITDSAVTANTAVQGTNGIGGGLHIQGSTVLTLDGVDLSGNTAEHSGGAINASTSTITFTDVTVSGNTAVSHGGGVRMYSSASLSDTDGVWSGNTTAGKGGAIHAGGSTSGTVFDGTTLSQNWSGSDGGAVSVGNGASITLTEATLSDNRADGSGGAAYTASTDTTASVVFDTCTLDGNTAGSQGGALHVGIATVTSSDFNDNDPSDTHSSLSDTSADFGTSASFSCGSSGCL